MWLSYRCFSARGEKSIPLSGGLGLAAQLGNIEYARPRKFREKLQDLSISAMSFCLESAIYLRDL
jgi:hypothetical protein